MENEVAAVESVNSEAQKCAGVATAESASQEVMANKAFVKQEKIVLCERDLNRTEEKPSNLHKQTPCRRWRGGSGIIEGHTTNKSRELERLEWNERGRV
jgi:hypothetical protein